MLQEGALGQQGQRAWGQSHGSAQGDGKVEPLTRGPAGLAVNWNNKVNTCGCGGTQSSFDLSPGQIN